MKTLSNINIYINVASIDIQNKKLNDLASLQFL